MWKLSTGTRIDSHVGVDFKDYVLVFIEEEDAEGRHLLRDAARLRNTWDDAHCAHYALDGGVVRRLQGLKRSNQRIKGDSVKQRVLGVGILLSAADGVQKMKGSLLRCLFLKIGSQLDYT